MSNTKNLDKVEEIYRETIRTGKNTVSKEKLRISWGGEFEFDAVVRENGKITEVHSLSVANFMTSSGKQGNSKLFKVFHDAQMMILTECKKCFLSFADNDFYNRVLREQENGRFFPSSQITVTFWDLRTLGLEKGYEVREYIDSVLIKSEEEIGVKNNGVRPHFA
jgi:hypothetical protein